MKTSPLLAHTYEPHLDPTGWWLSEKLDGIRCFWNPECRSFESRNGNPFNAPTWFTAGLPALPLDGELWMGRGQFDKASSVVRSGSILADRWDDVWFMVFDIPVRDAGPFEQRQAMLRLLAEKQDLGPRVKIVSQIKCTSRIMFEATMDEVVRAGGEGLMLRRPGSLYEHRRSSTLLKHKRFLDSEAIVIGHQAGAGRCVGGMGALICVLPNGTTFNIGTGFSDFERQNPPPVGSLVTFRFQELTKTGTPRFPVFVRIREPE